MFPSETDVLVESVDDLLFGTREAFLDAPEDTHQGHLSSLR